MTQQDLEKFLHAFVFCNLDYCNNTAARVLIKTRKGGHITLVLTSLNWLPARQNYFKMLLLVYKTTRIVLVQNISDILMSYEPPRLLRSESCLLSILRVYTIHLVYVLLISAINYQQTLIYHSF